MSEAHRPELIRINADAPAISLGAFSHQTFVNYIHASLLHLSVREKQGKNRIALGSQLFFADI